MTEVSSDNSGDSPSGPQRLLAGLTVIELASSIKAAYCARLFCEWGAEVVKVELPGHEPRQHERLWLDRGKANVVLDWRTPAGRDLLMRLVGAACIVIHDIPASPDDWLPAFLERQKALDPALIITSISDLGDCGPFESRPSSDLIVAALSGICMINGRKDSTPLREPGNQTALVAALAAFIGTLAARANAVHGGGGQSVHVSALEAMVNVIGPTILQCSYQADAPKRRESADGFLFDCADGQVSIIVSSQRSWQTILDIWAIELNPADERFNTDGARRKHIDAVREVLRPALSTRLRKDVFAELCSVRVPCGMLLSPAELPMDPHLVERGSMTPARERSEDQVTWLPSPSFRIAGQNPSESGADRLHAHGEDTAVALSLATVEGPRL